MPNGELIKKIRMTYCEEQKEFCRRFPVSLSAISAWENNRRTPRIPQIRMLVELAKKVGLKIKFEDFFNENTSSAK